MTTSSPLKQSTDEITVPEYLVAKYAVTAPRYTSYPTAVEFSNSFTDSRWLQLLGENLERQPGSRPLSLYFHIPFCRNPCYFCACHKVVPKYRKVVRPYLDALIAELNFYSKYIPKESSVNQIHWGGGSPDFLRPDEICELQEETLTAFCRINSDADVSVEIDPRTASVDHVSAFARSGFNRVSIGVQDFDPVVQETINRVQSYELTRDLCQEFRRQGLTNINIDLIYGLPNQTLKGFSDTLERIVDLRPNRIALYGYAHVTWLKTLQRILDKAHIPDPLERITLFTMALKRLTDEGYCHIGMDHFALPHDPLTQALQSGRLNRNFMGYTTHRGAAILGCGASSISSLSTAYAQNEKDLNNYLELVGKKGIATTRGVERSQEDQLRGEIIESILCNGIIDIQLIERRWDINFWEKFAAVEADLTALEHDGLVVIESDNLQVTPIGRIFARNVATAFDAYLEKYQDRKRRVFSQAV